MTLTDLLICYATYRTDPDSKRLARYLREVCKVIRDCTTCQSSKLVCRRTIKLVALGQYDDAVHCIHVGFEEFYIREACRG